MQSISHGEKQTYSQYVLEAARKFNEREWLDIPDSRCMDAASRAILERTYAACDNLDLDLIDREFIHHSPDLLDFSEASGQQAEEAKRKTRRERKEQKRQRAILELRSGCIGGRHGGFKRATMWQINSQAQKNKDMERFLAQHVAVGKNNERIVLTNSFQRKMAEFAIVAQGIQKVAEGEGMAWVKVVVSLPPEFHINPTRGKNTWNGTLPDVSCRLLQKQWSKCRAALAKDDIKLIGLWTRETHCDGTPHINFILYLPVGSDSQVEQTFRKYMALGNTSPKAITFEKKQQYEFNGKCGFAKYCAKGFAKYSAKNIDTSDPANIDALAEQSLASAFGWRRWGFFGIPPLSQWRALRSQKDNPNATPLLNSMWRAARGNDFAAFVQLNGGIGAKAKKRTIKTFAEASESGKSSIVVGVVDKAQNFYLRTKTIGYFELIRIQNKEVTLKITYPRNHVQSYPWPQNQPTLTSFHNNIKPLLP